MKRKFIWWLGFVTLFVFSVAAYGQWPTYQGDFQRTGASGASIDPSTLTLDWFFQPGVGNPLNPGTPNGTGIVFINEGQSPVVGFGKVFYVYNDNLDQDVLVALDAATGAYSWHLVIRLPGLGSGGLQVPTVAVRDTGGPAPDTVVYVYGSNNSVHARKASDGSLIWSRTGINGVAAALVSGAPIVFDTLLIIHDNGGSGTLRRHVSALNTRDGSTVWTSAQVPFRMFNGPSIVNDTVYVSGRGAGISGDGGGAIYALDANTGATLATYDPALPYGWQHAPSVFGPWVVSVSRNDALGAYAGSVHKLSHDLTTTQIVFPGPPGTSIGLDRFGTPELYIEPSVGESTMIYSVAGDGGDGLPGFVVMRRFAPAISLRSYQKLAGPVNGPGSVAAGNGLLLQGDDAGYWWIMDGNSYGGAFFGGLYPFWIKQYPSQLTGGAAISPEDDTLVAQLDGNGNVAGWRNGSVTTRPRAQIYFDYNDPNFSGGNLGLPTTQIDLGIIPTDTINGTGGFTNVKVKAFMNTGNDVLTYSLSHGSSPVVLSAADFGGAINMSRVHPTRNKMAREFADEMTVTSGNAFLEKKYYLASKSIRDQLDMEEDGITSLKDLRDLNAKATYFGTTKLEEAKKTLANPGWLFVNDETGGSVGAGDSVYLDIVAVNPNVGFGEFFGEIKLHSTNEPDVQGNPLDTTRLPVRLLVGWLPERGTLHASGADLTKTNYGREVCFPDDYLWTWHGVAVGFNAWTVLGNSDSTFAGADVTSSSSDLSDQPQGFYGPEDVFNVTTLTNLAYDGPFTDAVNHDFHSTKYAHQNGLPLKVLQYGWAIQDDLPGATYEGDVVYQTYVVINTSNDTVYGVEIGLTHDIDVPPAAGSNLTGIDTQHDNIWAYETTVPDNLQGYFRLPRDNVSALIEDPTPLPPDVSDTVAVVYGSDVLVGQSRGCPGFTEYYDPHSAALQGWWDAQEKSVQGCAADVWIVNGARKFDLAPGEFHTETFVWWGADLSSGKSLVNRMKEWALIAGYYRGDVDGFHQGDGAASGITITDVKYLGLYVSSGGPAPIPFTSQGDVNGDDVIDVADVSFLNDYVTNGFGNKPCPIDRDRFVPAPWNNRATGRNNYDANGSSLNDDANWTP